MFVLRDTRRDIGNEIRKIITMAVQMTNEQLQALIAALTAAPTDGGPALVAGPATVVGQMPPCLLGKDKIKRFKRWKDWIRDAETKMAFLGMSTDQHKINFIRSCAGPDLTEFWEKEAHIRFTAVPANEAAGIAAVPARTFDEIVTESKGAM